MFGRYRAHDRVRGRHFDDGGSPGESRGEGRGEGRGHQHGHHRGHGRHGGGFGLGDERGGDGLLGGGGRGGRGPHAAGRRRGRAIDGGGLQLLLLSLLSVEARHGYELIRAIEEMTDGHYAPSPGMVYPALAFLEDGGLIAVADADGARKSFVITDAGREKQAADAGQLAMVEARLAALAGQTERSDIQPVRRAMQNLRVVLMARLSAGELPTEMQHRIVDIIDDAAKQIERIA